ncbi:MAG: nucleoside-diphosphate sugar epimerase/dehydratase [Caldilineaceae bacterium]
MLPSRSPKVYFYRVAQRLLYLRNRHFCFLDLLIWLTTPALALYLRTDDIGSFSEYGAALLFYTIGALIIQMLLWHSMGLYRYYWRFAGVPEFTTLIYAAMIAFVLAGLFYLSARIALSWFNLPRSILPINAMLYLLLVGALRTTVRLTESVRARAYAAQAQLKSPARVMIYGAGYTGALIAREIGDNQNINLELVGFIDDDSAKHLMRIHNVPVLGGRQQLRHLLRVHHVERLIIAMPAAPGTVIREITRICHEVDVRTQIMPGLHELLSGAISISRLRNTAIEDLLRRAPIETDVSGVMASLHGRRVLVTGGGGSIGRELCRQILRCQPAQLILVGHGENSIFEAAAELRQLQQEQRAQASVEQATEMIPVIADLRFRTRILGIVRRYQPQVIFHAAAHKHVPLMEANPVEAITNNVRGTQILLEAAQLADVERFVMISTDKAVNPTNVMGASKRIAEMLVLHAAHTTGRFYQVVRFGNVLGSRGSVIHTFRRQIERGGPVTVTHPDIIRFFMTIPEAVQLVLQASMLGAGGEVLMLDMGEPVKIVDLARDLIELNGLHAGTDIEITFSGLRPGEKLFEEMFIAGEEYGRTAHEKILVAHNASHFVPANLLAAVDDLVAAALDSNNDRVLALLKAILPEYNPRPQPASTAAGGEEVGAAPKREVLQPQRLLPLPQ